MDENKFIFFKYCSLLLIDNDNHSKIFISEKNIYYIRYVDDNDDNNIVYYKILNNFDCMLSVRNNIKFN